PAVAGILRDLPRSTMGHALIELYDSRDRQELTPPPGVQVTWLERDPSSAPGTEALPALAALEVQPENLQVFAVGESGLATGARPYLVRHRDGPKSQTTCPGYWKKGSPAARA